MIKAITLALLGAAMMSLAACAHHEETQSTQASTASAGYKK
jgi:hypothetical protein